MFWSCGLWNLTNPGFWGRIHNPPNRDPTQNPRPNSGEARASPETCIDREIYWRLQAAAGEGLHMSVLVPPLHFPATPSHILHFVLAQLSAEQNRLSLARTNTPAMKTNVNFRNFCITYNILLNTIRPQHTNVSAQKNCQSAHRSFLLASFTEAENDHDF